MEFIFHRILMYSVFTAPSADTDKTPCSVASNLGLHCLIRSLFRRINGLLIVFENRFLEITWFLIELGLLIWKMSTR